MYITHVLVSTCMSTHVGVCVHLCVFMWLMPCVFFDLAPPEILRKGLTNPELTVLNRLTGQSAAGMPCPHLLCSGVTGACHMLPASVAPRDLNFGCHTWVASTLPRAMPQLPGFLQS